MRITLTLATLGLVVAACGSDADPATTVPPPPGTDLPPTVPTDPPPVTLGPGDDGTAAQAARPGEFDVTFRVGVSGVLQRDDRGCWTVAANGEDVFVVLPEGFVDDGTALAAPDGGVLPAGSVVDARGALFSIDGLPGGAEGRLGSLAQRCRPGSPTVVVTDRVVVDDFDPTALDDAALAALIEQAELDVDWPCGFGFAASTDDQRVGLYVDPADFERPPAGTISLPDAGWRADVVVGKHLFVDHCDDVAEWFEPDRLVAATFPLSAGTFEFVPPRTAPADEPVAIVIDGAVVDGPAGPIPLGTVTIVNDAFGFFAG